MAESWKSMRELFAVTLAIYRDSVTAAFRGIVAFWWFPLAPLAYGIVFWLLSFLAAPLGIAGGFLLGFALAVLGANYLALIRTATVQQKAPLSDIATDTRELFFPVLGSMFALYILSLVSSGALTSPGVFWVRASLSFALLVLFNPLPEVICWRWQGLFEGFQESLVFMKDNSVEWLLPMIILLLPAVLANPGAVLFSLSQTDPLRFPELLLVAFTSLGFGFSSSGFLLVLVLALYLVFFVMLFRGHLFRVLGGSTRRKRLYQRHWGQD